MARQKHELQGEILTRLGGGVHVEPEGRAQRLTALFQRARALKQGSKNPYKTSFRNFLRDCCWTKDEARGGKCAQVPDWPLFDDLCDYYIEQPLLMLEKSRRVLASWITCCFDLWVAGGGQDPRWPVLLNADGNRQVIVASRKFDGLQGSAWFLRSRVKFIYDRFEKDAKLWEKWPDFPRIRWIEGRGICSNGSEITAVAQGADQLRGPGATLIHLEELAFWEQAQTSVEGALPVVRGGGHVIAITTPNSASYAKRIRDGKLRDGGWL